MKEEEKKCDIRLKKERERHDATDSKLKFLQKKKQTKIELE